MIIQLSVQHEQFYQRGSIASYASAGTAREMSACLSVRTSHSETLRVSVSIVNLLLIDSLM